MKRSLPTFSLHILTGHFLLKVALGFLLCWSLIAVEHGVALDSIPPLPAHNAVGVMTLLPQPEEIRELVIYSQVKALPLKGMDEDEDLVFADVYFDERRLFIDAPLKGIFLKTVEWLNQEPEWRLQIEGHCDSRGTSAYNLARADFHLANLTQYLLMLGGQSHQISSINYGQDPVACRATSESCQEDNLRAQHIFSNLAIRHTQRGCLTRLRFVPGQDRRGASRYTQHLPNLQRIQVASSSTSF